MKKCYKTKRKNEAQQVVALESYKYIYNFISFLVFFFSTNNATILNDPKTTGNDHNYIQCITKYTRTHADKKVEMYLLKSLQRENQNYGFVEVKKKRKKIKCLKT